MTFQDLGLIAPILSALGDMGYEKPSPIQEKAIPPALAGRDVLGCAQTGTGKTCAFAAPILQRLSQSRPDRGGQDDPKYKRSIRPIRALILTPTRELALQIQESFVSYGKNLPLRSAVIFGGVGQQPQVDALRRGWISWWPPPGGSRTSTTRGSSMWKTWKFLCWTRLTGCWTWASSTTCGRF